MNERIRELRKELKLNQTEFGKAIGLTQKPVSEMEQGGTVTERNFNAICKAFDVNPEWLRYGVGEMFLETREAIIREVAEEYKLTSSETALVRAFLELEPEDRAGVLKFAEEFSRKLAAEMGVELPAPQRQKPDSELTRAEKHALLDAELDAVESAARKRATLTLSAFTGTNG